MGSITRDKENPEEVQGDGGCSGVGWGPTCGLTELVCGQNAWDSDTADLPLRSLVSLCVEWHQRLIVLFILIFYLKNFPIFMLL